MFEFRLHIFCIIMILVLTNCELQRTNQPSVLVIAVEGLSFESLSCESEEANDRIFENTKPFCEESVRFSHAFAPSTMSQPSLASLMTGLYPIDHGVRNNGSDFLSAKFRTVAEGSLSKGYHTLFVSGGVPIFRKSGLAQGFEVFDDTGDIALGTYYRPASDVVKIALNWFEHESANLPFFATLYFNDLQFPQIATKTKEGELREKTPRAQLESVSEALAQLVRWLKNKHKWNSTNVVLVGLNSLQHHDSDNEPMPLSLKSSSVQVTLFVKPARREGDNVMQWAVDRNVSLVDVGRTMFEWMGLEAPKASIDELAPESLLSAVNHSAPNLRDDRLIMSESAWPDWLEGSGIRYSVRQQRFLYIADQKPLIFNTLTDRMEALPLKKTDPLWIATNGQVLEALKKSNLRPWQGMRANYLRMIEVAYNFWKGEMSNQPPSEKVPWLKWYLRQALKKRDWKEVRRLAQLSGDSIGTFVASRNLGENVNTPREPCLRLVLPGKWDKKLMQAECEDEGILALHSWQVSHNDDERVAYQERFMRLYSIGLLDQEVGRLNYLNELAWDVEREMPLGPQTLDYLLTLKEFEPFAKKASSLLSNKDMAL